MRYLLFFFVVFFCLHTYSVFAQEGGGGVAPHPSCPTGWRIDACGFADGSSILGQRMDSCAQEGGSINSFGTCSNNPNKPMYWCGFGGCSCPEPYVLNTVIDHNGREITSCVEQDPNDSSGECDPEVTECPDPGTGDEEDPDDDGTGGNPDDPDGEGPDMCPDPAKPYKDANGVCSACSAGQVLNLQTDQCESLTTCTYPDYYDWYSNSCRTNSQNCAIGASYDPITGGCKSVGETSCPDGWQLTSDLLRCEPATGSGNSSQSGQSSSRSSSPSYNTSSQRSSSPTTGGGGGGGGGNNSSVSSNGSGSGNGSGQAGNCDPTAHNYLSCISQDGTGNSEGEGEGFNPGQKGEFDGSAAEARKQELEQEISNQIQLIKQEIADHMGGGISGYGTMSDDCQTIRGTQVCFGFARHSSLLDVIAGAIFLVACVISFYIVVGR